jgi:formylglycine-generating enzyme required for sulfatase activity
MKNTILFLLLILGATASQGQVLVKMSPKVEKPKAEAKTKIIYVDKSAKKTQSTSKSGIEPVMVSIQGGTFNMGSNESDDEKPIHSVTVSSFKMGKYEITQAQWKAIMKTNPSNFSGCDNCPVENVSYIDIQDFIEELNYKTGKKYRLPTEAEWEFAARGGNNSNNYTYSGSSTLSKIGWSSENSENRTHAVGELRPNELGLFDMTGNVWEWCSDWYDSSYYSNSPSSNPRGPSSGSNRVLRGGGWSFTASSCRVANRNYDDPTYRYNYSGFRVVLSQ